MSYYFAIIGTKDNPIFEHEFGTSRQGGDGVAHFRDEARHMNQFIVHSSLDIVEEVQWTTGAMYLKSFDRFYNNYISAFQTGSGFKFLLLHCPDPNATYSAHSHGMNPLAGGSSTSSPARPSSPAPSSSKVSRSSVLGSVGSHTSHSGGTGAGATNSVAHNPLSPAAEEAHRQFFADVYENWVKACMNPFYKANERLESRVFRQRVAAAARKYL